MSETVIMDTDGAKAVLTEATPSNTQGAIEWDHILNRRGVIGYLDTRDMKAKRYEALVYGGGNTQHQRNLKIWDNPTFRMREEYVKLANETGTYRTPEAIPLVYAREFVREAFQAATARKIFPTDSTLVNKPGNTLIIPNLNHLVSGVGQAAEDWSSSNTVMDTGSGIQIKPLKYGVRVEITQEDIEDSWANWIGEAGRNLGEAYANYEDRLIYFKGLYQGIHPNNKVTKSNNYWSDAVGWAENIENDITDGINKLKLGYHNPSHILANTRVTKYMMRHPDFLHYDIYGGQKTIHDETGGELRGVGIPGRIWGCDVVETTNLATTMTFDSATSEDNIAIIDAARSIRICEKRPLTVKQNPYNDADMEKTIVVATTRVAPYMVYPTAGYYYSNLIE